MSAFFVGTFWGGFWVPTKAGFICRRHCLSALSFVCRTLCSDKNRVRARSSCPPTPPQGPHPQDTTPPLVHHSQQKNNSPCGISTHSTPPRWVGRSRVGAWASPSLSPKPFPVTITPQAHTRRNAPTPLFTSTPLPVARALVRTPCLRSARGDGACGAL